LKWRHVMRKEEDGVPDISYLQCCGSKSSESDPYLCLTDPDADPEHW
jgi:hypothetical protein